MDDRVDEVAASLSALIVLLRRLNPPSEFSLTVMGTLATLERSGPCRITELAAGEAVSQPAMTQLVSRLEHEGLAVREADPGDGRVVLVHLTQAGRTALAARRATRSERLAELVRELGPDDFATLAAAVPAVDALTRLGSTAPARGARQRS
jgi:DNA-binding MarR family transcriptional regulator